MLDEMEQRLLREIITGHYRYVDEVDISSIEQYCRQVLDQPEPSADLPRARQRRQHKIADALFAYLEQNNVMNVAGFIRFRLSDYMDELREVAEYAIDEYIMDQQYQEFISLLKYFVYIQETKIPVAHLMHRGGNEFTLYNEQMKTAFDAAEARFGAVDVVINNAGIGDPGRFLELGEEDWQRMLSTNLDGVFRVAQCASQRLVKAGRGGSIINIASILGLRVGLGLSHYCTAKAGVVQLTKAMALELARHRIRVNAIAPGYFRTEMNDAYFDSEAGQNYIRDQIPLRRLGQLAELNGPLLLLASEAGAFMTGSVLAVDGGHLVNPL